MKAATRTSAELRVRGEAGQRLVAMLLSPDVPARVQAYEVDDETRP